MTLRPRREPRAPWWGTKVLILLIVVLICAPLLVCAVIGLLFVGAAAQS